MSTQNAHEETPAEVRLTRRQFLGLTAAAAAAAAATSALGAAPAFAQPARAQGVLIPPGKLGIILYTVRDAISRDPTTSDLPSGFREVLEYLAKVGFYQIEFTGFTQNANAEGGRRLDLPDNNYEGARLLRQWLDDNGLVCNGNHGTVPSTINDTTRAQFSQYLDVMEILGAGHVGTGSDPTSSSYVADWDAAIDRWNYWGGIAAERGLRLYTHSHHASYSFLLDSPPLDANNHPTRSTGVRRLQYFLNHTDPELVDLEMDVMWAYVARNRYQTYTNPDGDVVTDLFDPAAQIAAQPHRYPLLHAKGGVEAQNADGYSISTFPGDLDYVTFYRSIGPKGYPISFNEQDNASSYPDGGSLGAAAVNFNGMSTLRG
jgi:sugar phosphate isomerase/epimerase